MASIPTNLFATLVNPYLNIEELINLYQTSKLGRAATIDQLLAVDISNVDKFPLNKLFDLGHRVRDLRTRVILEILKRLHSKMDMTKIFTGSTITDKKIYDNLLTNPNFMLSDVPKLSVNIQNNIWIAGGYEILKILLNPNITENDTPYLNEVLRNSGIIWGGVNKTYREIIADYASDMNIYPLKLHVEDYNHSRSLLHRYDLTEDILADVLGEDGWNLNTVSPKKLPINLALQLKGSPFTPPDKYTSRYTKLIVPDYIKHGVKISGDNPVFSMSDYQQYPGLLDMTPAEKSTIFRNPNFTTTDLIQIANGRNIYDIPETFSNINIDFNGLLNFIKSQPIVFDESIQITNVKLNNIQRSVNNANFDMNQCDKIIEVLPYINPHMAAFPSANPNITLDYISKYRTQISSADWPILASNKFTKDPDYRTLAYRYIYRLLPREITLTVNGVDLTLTKQQAYGIMAAVKILDLHKSYGFKYAGYSLDIDDYRMFDKNTAEQPFVVKIRGEPFFFTNIGFLQGVKGVYITNNIPFDIPFYMDKSANYQKVSIN